MPQLHGKTSSRIAEFEGGVDAQRSVIVPRGVGFAAAGTTGVIAAALAAGSSVFAARLDPGADRRAFVERIRLQFTTLAAFTTPVTAGRRIGLYRGAGAANPSTGTVIAPAAKHGVADTSEFSDANGGQIRIAATGAITITGATFEATPFAEMSLVHVGAAGAFMEALFEMSAADSQPIQLDPGQILALRTPIAMDAGGTWQVTVRMDWHEAPALDFAD
jgi:hypothetical protein